MKSVERRITYYTRKAREYVCEYGQKPRKARRYVRLLAYKERIKEEIRNENESSP